jgi:hypothetical protein
LQIRALTLEVASRLLEVLVVQYPALREAVRGVARSVLEEAHASALEALDDLLRKEKDPFTVNDFLEQHINKLRWVVCTTIVYFKVYMKCYEVYAWTFVSVYVRRWRRWTTCCARRKTRLRSTTFWSSTSTSSGGLICIHILLLLYICIYV